LPAGVFLGLLAFALLPQLLVFAGWLITGAIAIALAIALVVPSAGIPAFLRLRGMALNGRSFPFAGEGVQR
jgi:hypothetical protein